MFGSRLLSGLDLRTRFRSSARRSRTLSRRRAGYRPDVAAEVSLLESRCLLSNGAPVPIEFAGYVWNANYNWSGDSGNYINHQLWSPSGAVVEADGLHLSLTPAKLDGHNTLASAEVELVGKVGDSNPYNPGYGTYLVTAKTNGGFDHFADNKLAIFGAFTYENLHGTVNDASDLSGNAITGLPASLVAELHTGYGVTGSNYLGNPFYPDGTVITKIDRGTDTVYVSNSSQNVPPGMYPHTVYFVDNSAGLLNHYRELDEVEASRFGLAQDTNAQFTVQPTTTSHELKTNVKRITLDPKYTGPITFVMKWTAANTPITYSVYYGSYDLSQVKMMTPAITWNEFPVKYTPDSTYQTFHLNLWQAWWKFSDNYDHARPTEVTVTNFQYEK